MYSRCTSIVLNGSFHRWPTVEYIPQLSEKLGTCDQGTERDIRHENFAHGIMVLNMTNAAPEASEEFDHLSQF
ncbi:hypothetical protein DTO212C5_9227 [Paecilomyces variotii]|nr:hypothetical protein DTO212C5_9227 [Paecilomyces variotii]